MDATGHPVSDNDVGLQRVSAELVQGRAEVIYWQKVPEKVKRGAISNLKDAKPFEPMKSKLTVSAQNVDDPISSAATPTSAASVEESASTTTRSKKVTKRVQDTEEEDPDRERKRRRKV